MDRLAGEEVCSADAILPGSPFLRRTAKAIEMGHHADLREAEINQERHELCLRQSAGDSTGPKIDVAPDVIAEFGIDDDVAKLKPSARTRDPPNLSERSVLFGNQVEHAVRDDNIDAGISPDAPLCLRCGAHMLKRTGSFGPFWGCSQFPPCRATQKRAECDSARG